MNTMAITPMIASRLATIDILSAVSILVIVAPMFAPMMIQTACSSVMMEEPTNDTSMTVVADELCTSAVTPAPTRMLMMRLDVSFSNTDFIEFPAVSSRPFDIMRMPYRNNASPPSIETTISTISPIVLPPTR